MLGISETTISICETLNSIMITCVTTSSVSFVMSNEFSIFILVLNKLLNCGRAEGNYSSFLVVCCSIYSLQVVSHLLHHSQWHPLSVPVSACVTLILALPQIKI